MKKVLMGLLGVLLLCGCGDKTKELSLDEVIESNDYIVVDVRTKEEYAAGHVKEAINIPYDTINSSISLSKDKPILVYCQSGVRSKIAYQTLKDLGYQVYDLGSYNSISLEKVEKEVLEMKVIIDKKEYEVNLENNETVKALHKLLPLELTMKDLNKNEKYYYLDEKLPVNSEKVKEIKKGDIMIYEDNCLVIFYKSFKTDYAYTKIGHIDNLDDLGTGSLRLSFE